MRLSDRQIRKLLCEKEHIVCDEAHMQRVIWEAKTAFCESEDRQQLSSAEFLYLQSKYIRKRWWVLQGGILLLLWFILSWTKSSFGMHRCMGIAAPLFAVLLLPELWKNRSTGTMEIECSVYYSLRQIYAARIFLFAVVDFLLICSFSFAAVLTGKLFVEEILIQFILPYIVTCCICFRTLYSRKICSEALAVLLCIVWCAVWTQLVLNEKLYKMISLPVWMAMLVISILCLGRFIYRGQKCCEEMWEVKPIWS